MRQSFYYVITPTNTLPLLRICLLLGRCALDNHALAPGTDTDPLDGDAKHAFDELDVSTTRGRQRGVLPAVHDTRLPARQRLVGNLDAREDVEVRCAPSDEKKGGRDAAR
jgi:hypothetical protein